MPLCPFGESQVRGFRGGRLGLGDGFGGVFAFPNVGEELADFATGRQVNLAQHAVVLALRIAFMSLATGDQGPDLGTTGVEFVVLPN